MRAYSGLSSSGEDNFAKEESYRIACSFGTGSHAHVVASVDQANVGLLPNWAGVGLSEACSDSFAMPEVQWDLLKVPNLELLEATSFHAISVRPSCCLLFCLC